MRNVRAPTAFVLALCCKVVEDLLLLGDEFVNLALACASLVELNAGRIDRRGHAVRACCTHLYALFPRERRFHLIT